MSGPQDVCLGVSLALWPMTTTEWKGCGLAERKGCAIPEPRSRWEQQFGRAALVLDPGLGLIRSMLWSPSRLGVAQGAPEVRVRVLMETLSPERTVSWSWEPR